jgi:hypothetical protein
MESFYFTCTQPIQDGNDIGVDDNDDGADDDNGAGVDDDNGGNTSHSHT